jgi:hypothetical protein
MRLVTEFVNMLYIVGVLASIQWGGFAFDAAGDVDCGMRSPFNLSENRFMSGTQNDGGPSVAGREHFAPTMLRCL